MNEPPLSSVLALLADVDAAMKRLGLNWYVFGAQAACLYGQPRMSADVDITIGEGPLSVPALARALEDAGFSLRIALSGDFLRTTHFLPFVHKKTGMPIDMVIASTALQAEFMARRKQMDIQGVHVSLISPEDLVVTKVLAGRRKDLADIRGILDVQRTTLDMHYIRRLLSELSSALSDPRLLSRFERLLRAHK